MYFHIYQIIFPPHLFFALQLSQKTILIIDVKHFNTVSRNKTN